MFPFTSAMFPYNDSIRDEMRGQHASRPRPRITFKHRAVTPVNDEGMKPSPGAPYASILKGYLTSLPPISPNFSNRDPKYPALGSRHITPELNC